MVCDVELARLRKVHERLHDLSRSGVALRARLWTNGVETADGIPYAFRELGVLEQGVRPWGVEWTTKSGNDTMGAYALTSSIVDAHTLVCDQSIWEKELTPMYIDWENGISFEYRI